MKYIISVMSLVCVLLISGTIACAAEPESTGAGLTGTSVFLGYDRSYLSYEESMNGGVLDKDTGWNNGVYVEARHDDESLFARFLFDYVETNSATYAGSLQNGTPITMSTEEKFLTFEGNVGFKALNFSTVTLSPYAGLGYRDWKRGSDNLPDYREDYSWWYVAAGGNVAYRLSRLVIAADFALLYPFSSKMTTNIAGLVDEATFDIKPHLGYRVEVPVNYEISQNNDVKIFVFGTPFYQKWKFGASDPVTLTQGGMPVASAIEPDSSTVMYGFRVGVGLNF
ncbi:MAG TPA: hypothetical protein VL197_11650 [Nitrospirota bacterium]|nr:hypothetical protein [Nitrospirota bacterium]